MKKQLLLMALVATMLSIGLQPAASAPRGSSPVASHLNARRVRLGSVEQFKTAFDNDRDKVRLVALVSPT